MTSLNTQQPTQQAQQESNNGSHEAKLREFASALCGIEIIAGIIAGIACVYTSYSSGLFSPISVLIGLAYLIVGVVCGITTKNFLNVICNISEKLNK